MEGDNSMMYGAQMQAFVEAVEQGSDIPIPAENGLKVLRVIDAVFESNKLKQEVNF